jgi:stearoyl-CoA desaturase (delta-9 desaturase)
VHHMTFCINSLCHWIGDRPYSSKCSARDSLLMAFFTFGEGYHNYHHEFQYDYRNGVKPWQFDPTKWTIWLLHKVGLVKNLRTVPEERIIKAQIAEQERRHTARLASHGAPICESVQAAIHTMQQKVNDALAHWEGALTAWRQARDRRHEVSATRRRELKRELDVATERLRTALQQWQDAYRLPV